MAETARLLSDTEVFGSAASGGARRLSDTEVFGTGSAAGTRLLSDAEVFGDAGAADDGSRTGWQVAKDLAASGLLGLTGISKVPAMALDKAITGQWVGPGVEAIGGFEDAVQEQKSPQLRAKERAMQERTTAAGKAAEEWAGGGPRTHDGLPALANADGTHSTELTITVTDPRLNGGKPTNVPSLWGRKVLDESGAVDAALKSGRSFPAFGTIDEAVTAAKARSAAGGASDGGWMPTTARMLAEFGTGAWEAVKDPALLSSQLAQQVPMLGASRIGGMATGAAAKAAGAGARVAGAAAVGGAVGTGAALQGADIGTDAYQRLMALQDEQWAAVPGYKELAAEIGAEPAKSRMASGKAMTAAGQAAVASLLSTALPGGASVERALVDKGLSGASIPGAVGKAFVGEAVQEGVEEGFGAGAANEAVQGVDPTQRLSEGVGAAAGQGAALGGIMGGGAAGVSAMRAPGSARWQSAETAPPLNASVGGDRQASPASALGQPGIAVDPGPATTATRQVGAASMGRLLADDEVFHGEPPTASVGRSAEAAQAEEARLAELELTAAQRPLNADERTEVQQLLVSLDEADRGQTQQQVQREAQPLLDDAAVGIAVQEAGAETVPATLLNPNAPDSSLQNRDRTRAASVAQMAEIARNPDYARLGISRTPAAGAPMVFAVADDFARVPNENLGQADTAVMADGQRVPFRYAAVEAKQVEPSNFADGTPNPMFASERPGTLKALNNARAAGVRAAHELGSASTYVQELRADAQSHGIAPEIVDRTRNPMLVRIYSEQSNTRDMAARSQGQVLGLSPVEQARQDAGLIDGDVLASHRRGDVVSAANRDFVRAFVGKAMKAGQDVASMLTESGALSAQGRQRLDAALMQAAYSDADLVAQMFESADTDIKAIGEALKAVAGSWASMRDAARQGAIAPDADITENLLQVVRLIRKARGEHRGLVDLLNQPDLLTGEAPDLLTAGLMRLFYSGRHLTVPMGRDAMVRMLSDYLAAVSGLSVGPDLLGDRVGAQDVVRAITTPRGDSSAQTGTTQGGEFANSGNQPGSGAAESRAAAARPADDRRGSGSGADRDRADVDRRSDGSDRAAIEGAASGEPAASRLKSETGKGKPASLYASRPVTNAQAIIDWAASQGFKTTLPAADMHVTVAYSRRDAMDGAAVPAGADAVAIPGGKRSVAPLGDNGAVVLKFSSAKLQHRWQQYRDAGASWDYDGYQPHITITYDGKGMDLAKVEPYRGPIELGAETQEPLHTDSVDAAKASEVPTPKSVESAPDAAAVREARTQRLSEKRPVSVATVPSSQAAIEDAGEKIGGARKDQWAERGLSATDLDAMSESEGAQLATKANVWKPDYAAMAAEVGEPVTVAMVKVVYDALAAKPKSNTPQGRRDYVTAMQAVRTIYGAVKTPEEAKEAYRKLRQALGVEQATGDGTGFVRTKNADASRVLFSLYKGRSDPFVLGYNELARARKLVNAGFPGAVEPWTRRLVVRSIGGDGITDAAVKVYLRDAERLGTPLTEEQLRAGAWQVRDKAGHVMAFAPSKADAEAAAKAVYDGLKAGGEALKEPQRPHLDKLKREGVEQTIDRNVTASDFIEGFGFRGVEWGNWAAQDERQKIANLAYDALADLARILNVPRRALSLNGTMGMAFGARGGGKFAAHYEPGKLVINLTKLRGAGSLAHEWAHAFDHYFGELGRPDAYQTLPRGASGWMSEEQYQGKPVKRMVKDAAGKWVNTEVRRLGNLRPELAEKIDAVMRTLFIGRQSKADMLKEMDARIAGAERYVADAKENASLREMYARQLENFRAARAAIESDPDTTTYPKGRSQFAAEAQKLSGKSTAGYWLRPTEMFARAFESYVFDRLVANGAKSEYLVHGVEPERYAGGGYRGNPYPTGAERAKINAAFDAMVAELKSREEDGGAVALYDLSRIAQGVGRMGYEKEYLPRIQASRRLATLIRRLDAGEIDRDAFEVDVRGLADSMDRIVQTKAANRLMTERERGPDMVREKLVRARRHGALSEEAVDLALWALDQNPAIAENLGMSILAPREHGTAGQYNPAAEIVRLFKGAENVETAVHEILHHTERMMPPDLQVPIRDAWARALAAAIKTATPQQVEALQLIPKAMSGDRAAHKALVDAIQDGPLNYERHYQLVNPSEFWAVNAARLLSAKHAARDSAWQRVREWLRGMVEKVKAALGLRSEAPIIRALQHLLDAENFGPERVGRFASDRMLSEVAHADLRNGGSGPPEASAPGRDWWTALKQRADALRSPETIDKLIYEAQDKFVDLKRMRDHIKQVGGTITDLNDAYLGEELYHKRAAYRSQLFLTKELEPLLGDLKAAGVPLAEFERFLHARHAAEANAVLAERNPSAAVLERLRRDAKKQLQDVEAQLALARRNQSATQALEDAVVQARAEANRLIAAQPYKGTEADRLALSGMSDAEARQLIDGLPPVRREAMERLAARVDAINAGTLRMLETYGLMSTSAVDAWRRAYQHYVPLHRDEAHVDTVAHPIGSGFSVKGDAARSRVGSREKVTDILGHIALQREAAITSGEKNQVGKMLYLMAAQNPDPKWWSIDRLPLIKTIDRATGYVRTGVDPRFKNLPNVLMLRVGGRDVAITFNEKNPRALRLAEAMKNLDATDMHVVLSLVARGTRWFASVNTQYNPIFGLINFARDLQAGLLNLSTTQLAGKQREVAAGVFKAMRAIYRAERNKTALDAEWTDLWREMQQAGGTTGYRDLFTDASDRTKALLKQLRALDRGQVSEAAHAVVDWLSDYNETMENAVRLSAYRVALQHGMTAPRAASLAKNLTVNFNRKGRQAREIGALYAFFNASVQGTARMADTLRGPLGQKIMLGGVMLGAATTLLGMAFMGGGDDDPWDRIPEFVKERSIIIPLGREDYIAVPMPLGFHIFPNIGRIAVEMAVGSHGKSKAAHIGSLLQVMLDAFNPIGGSQDIAQMAAPTVIDPIVALMENRDWTGRPIYRADSNPLDPQPGHALVKDSASTPSRLLARAINDISGGTEFRPGAWSPTPDQLDYLMGQLTGGLGRELLKLNQTIAAPLTGDELPAHKVPLLGRIYGNTRGMSGQSGTFYDNIRQINEVENELQGLQRTDRDTEDLYRTEPLAGLVGDANAAERRVRQLRRLRRDAVEQADSDWREQVRDIDNQIVEAMTELNAEVTRARRDTARASQ